MIRTRGALAILVLLAGAALAGGPAVDVGRRDLWKPDDVVTTTLREERVRELGEAGLTRPIRLRTEIVDVEKCLEADAEGNPTRTLHYFSTWTQDGGKEKDDSLAGAFVEVTGRGKERKWTLRASPRPPSKPASAWLERTFGAGRADPDDVRRAWLPKQPVAVGDEWPADLAGVMGTLATSETLDHAAAKSTARLESTDGVTSRISCAATLPLVGVPAGKEQKPTPWTRGGAYALQGTLTLTFGDRIAESRLSTTGTLEGEFEWKGHSMILRTKLDLSIECRRGGEMPAIPPPATAAPPTPTPATPAPPGKDPAPGDK